MPRAEPTLSAAWIVREVARLDADDPRPGRQPTRAVNCDEAHTADESDDAEAAAGPWDVADVLHQLKPIQQIKRESKGRT